MELGPKIKYPCKSPLTSPNQPKPNNGKRSYISPKLKFDFKHGFAPKQFSSYGIKQQHRKSTDRYKPHQPLKMLFNNDPLNLASLCDKDGCDSPETSSPILDRSHEFEPANILPIDVSDPLNLNCDNEDHLVLKPPRKRRRRKRRNTYSGQTDELSKDDLAPKLDDSSIILISTGELVSPVDLRSDTKHSPKAVQTLKELPSVPITVLDEPTSISHGNNARKYQQFQRKVSTTSCNINLSSQKRHFNVKNVKYKYGNYAHYYGSSLKDDQRLSYFRKELFENKHCLDVGCNTGKLTCWIADHFSPKSIVGVDIDTGLIKLAKKNARQRHFVQKNSRRFPLSLELTLGPISKFSKHSIEGEDVLFKVENYAPPSDSLLEYIKPKYNTILCLSVTKWVQLNFGDDGLKRMFKKIYLQLYPGGKLLLEPQMVNSYKKKRNLTAITRKHFDDMKLLPADFIPYLLSNEVGFAQSECLGYTRRKRSGCHRPLYLLTKSGSVEKSN